MGVFLKDGDWYIDYYSEHRRKREKIGPSKKLALDVLRKRKVQIAEKRFLDVKKDNRMLFESLAKEFMDNYSKPNKRSSWRDVFCIKALSPHFAGKYLHEITPQLIERYKIERAKTVSQGTVNKELVCLKCMFNRAIDWKMTEDNPVSKVKFYRPNNKRLRYLELDEIVRLLVSCPPKLRSIVALALSTGMRRGEIRNLKWQDVDFQNGHICIAQQKNGELSYQRLHGDAKTVLMTVPRHPSSPYVFCKDNGRTYDIRKSFQTALRKAEIVDFHFHDLRHTFASHLAMRGVDLNTIRELLRHKDYKMTLRYAHLSKDHTSRALDALDGYLDTLKTPEQLADLQS